MTAMQVHSQRVFSKPISVRIGRKMGTTIATMPIQSMNMPMKNMRAIMKMKQPHLPMPTEATKFSIIVSPPSAKKIAQKLFAAIMMKKHIAEVLRQPMTDSLSIFHEKLL